MKMMKSPLLLFLLLLALVCPARATTIDPLSWKEMVVGADFIGIVECTVAGGMVAKYRVVDAWKGAENGQEVSIAIAVNVWEPQFPVSLRGERKLVVGYKSPPFTMRSHTSFGPVPLWWRRIPSDFRTPLFQGVYGVPEGPATRKLELEWEQRTSAELKQEVTDLLALSPEKREGVMLNYLIERRFPDEAKDGDKELQKALEAFWETMKKKPDDQGVIDALVKFGREGGTRASYMVETIFERGGGALSLKSLESLPPKQGPWREEWQRTNMLEKLRGQETPDEPARAAPKAPGEKELSKFRKVLKKPDSQQDGSFHEAFSALTEHDPAAVAAFLVNWENKGTDWQDKEMGYQLGSYFGHECGKDRRENLAKLLGAKDNWIRVAGAVYLTFEDREAGLAELRKLQSLPDDPGAWAALNLARRGEKASIPRLLEVLKGSDEGGMGEVAHRNLGRRVPVLFSNSAAKSGVPLPTYHAGEGAYDYYQDWWKKHGEKVTLHDAWLAFSEEQKVD
jgi:hypothetical protein